MTPQLRFAIVMFGALTITSCVFRTDESQLDSYIDDVNRMESRFVSELEVLLLDNPIVYDDAVAAQSSPAQIADGYSRYYLAALPHVENAITETNQLSPPDEAIVFHALLEQWLQENKELMTFGLIAFETSNQSGMIEFLSRMALLSAKRDLVALQLGALER